MGRAGGVAAAGLVSTAGFSASGLAAATALPSRTSSTGLFSRTSRTTTLPVSRGLSSSWAMPLLTEMTTPCPSLALPQCACPKLTPGGKKEIPGGLSNVKGCPVALAVASAICRTTKPASTLLSRTAAATARTVAPPRIHKNTRFIETPQVFAALAAA